MTILDLLHEHGITKPVKVSTAKGGEYHSACPGCGDLSKKTSDRFCSWPESTQAISGGDCRGSYWCRQCNKGGDMIQFLRDFSGLGFKEAKEKLGLSSDQNTLPPLHSHPLSKTKVQTTFSPDIKDHPSEVVDVALWHDKAMKFVDYCHEKLLNNEKSLGWLERRGINKETISRFKIGLNPGKGNDGSPDFRPWKSWGLRDEKKENGKQRTLILPAGIVIPQIIDNIVLRIRIRVARPEGNKKYHVVIGSSMGTMLLNPESKAFLIIETELDAFMLIQEVGDLVGVVALGSVATKPDMKTTDILHGSLKILNALDSDKPGANAGKWWLDNFKQTSRWPVPTGKDPGDAWQAGVNIRAWVIAGLPPVFTIDSEISETKINEENKTSEIQKVLMDLPESVIKLGSLLSKHPVKIHRIIENGDGGLEIKEDPKWAHENWDASKLISQLVFYDDDVFNYLSYHPDKIISGKNILTEHEG